eukprot:CAMPEP_0180643572 /NCGR_PEP_ID=MMETSP1037_2-20121125/47892_1 /TAXON_ID=632150 /ORGANISM="Azadinium spinosum, Strain 3D9" /LENGTH=169 /DNA_ID=CAMNT_0022667101 /DNA_START=34 /DNA_END=543 /DNA_ORIENTATION=+
MKVAVGARERFDNDTDTCHGSTALISQLRGITIALVLSKAAWNDGSALPGELRGSAWSRPAVPWVQAITKHLRQRTDIPMLVLRNCDGLLRDNIILAVDNFHLFLDEVKNVDVRSPNLAEETHCHKSNTGCRRNAPGVYIEQEVHLSVRAFAQDVDNRIGVISELIRRH